MVFDKVKELISEQLDVKADDITEASNIQDDLGADSLDVVDLVMALEDEFDVEIPEDQVENIKTVGDIVKFIEDMLMIFRSTLRSVATSNAEVASSSRRIGDRRSSALAIDRRCACPSENPPPRSPTME